MDSKIHSEIEDLKFNPALKRRFDQPSAVQNGKRMRGLDASCHENIFLTRERSVWRKVQVKVKQSHYRP
jgi:hypothetical protein